MRAFGRVFGGWVAGLALATVAGAVSVTDLTYVPGNGTGWSFYVGETSRNGGAAGEWTARVGGLSATGYFRDPWSQSMTSGTVTNLAGTPGAYKAAWLIDRFALGLGRDGVPPGWAGGPVSDADKRAALAFAVYEVGMSPEDDPLDLDDGYFLIWSGPAVPRSLG